MQKENRTEYNELVLRDLELVKKYKSTSDPLVLDELLKRWTHMVFGTAMQVMNDRNDAEDAVQEAYVKIIRNLKNYRGDYGIRSWVMRIVFNLCMDKKREEKKRKVQTKKMSERTEEIKDNSQPPDKNIELLELIKSKWETLPQHYRLPVWMRYYENMRFNEIASVLSLSEGTVKGQASRGLQKLKGLLAKSGVTLTTLLLTSTFVHMESKASCDHMSSQVSDIITNTLKNSDEIVSAKSKYFFTSTNFLVGVVSICCLVTALFYHWDFNLLKLFQNKAGANSFKPRFIDFNEIGKPIDIIEFLEGQVKYVETNQKKNPGYIRTNDKKAFFRLEIPKTHLPIKLTFKHAYAPNKINPVYKGMTCVWSAFDGSCHVNGWDTIEKNIKSKNKWMMVEVYLTKNAIIGYQNKSKYFLNIFDNANCDQVIFIFGYGHLIDDLSIEQVLTNQLPDIEKELAFVDSIPVKDRVGNIRSNIYGMNKSKLEFRFKPKSNLKDGDWTVGIMK